MHLQAWNVLRFVCLPSVPFSTLILVDIIKASHIYFVVKLPHLSQISKDTSQPNVCILKLSYELCSQEEAKVKCEDLRVLGDTLIISGSVFLSYSNIHFFLLRIHCIVSLHFVICADVFWLFDFCCWLLLRESWRLLYPTLKPCFELLGGRARRVPQEWIQNRVSAVLLLSEASNCHLTPSPLSVVCVCISLAVLPFILTLCSKYQRSKSGCYWDTK